MKTKTSLTMLFTAALGLGMVTCPKKSKVCVDFERPLVADTEYGSANPSQPPGTVVFTTNGIPVSVQNFVFLDGREFFGSARVVTQTSHPIGRGQKMQVGNINLEFDFSRFSTLGTPTSQVQFTFLDKGGFENISVNGSPPFVGDLSAAPSQIGGVGITVNTTALPPVAPGNPNSPGKKGTVTLTGAVKTLRIGGQEFWIDDVCAKK